MCYEYTFYLYSKEKSYSCEKDETTSVMLKLDTVKEVTWATKYQSDLPEILDTMCLAINYHSVMNKNILVIKSDLFAISQYRALHF